MMKQIKTFTILALLIPLMSSCIERRAKPSANADPNMTQSVDGVRVIRDTIIQVVILDTVDNRKQIVEEAPRSAAPSPRNTAPRSTASSTSAYSEENDRVDRSNSGFFDSYRSTYKGDPNKDLQPIVRTVVSNADDVDKQKAAIERELDNLQERNKLEQQKSDRLEKERQAGNQRAMDEAKAKQDAQQKQKQEPARGKTLNTDLFY